MNKYTRFIASFLLWQEITIRALTVSILAILFVPLFLTAKPLRALLIGIVTVADNIDKSNAEITKQIMESYNILQGLKDGE